MKFRLSYQGDIRATQRDEDLYRKENLAIHKHGIRREFHQQLKRLWETNKFLSAHKIHPDYKEAFREISDNRAYWGSSIDERIPLLDYVANQHQMFGYSFCPLVRKEFSLLCSLDVLFLRRDIPGNALDAGDIDNRVKSLIDCLRVPIGPQELVNSDANPKEDESPFFCLLENDDLVSSFSVETDTLLLPPTDDNAQKSKAESLIIVTVELRPLEASYFNLNFV